MTAGGAPGPEASGGALGFRPDPAEFAALAKEHTIVPVWCEVVADTLTPVTCFANVVGERDGFLFESVEGGDLSESDGEIAGLDKGSTRPNAGAEAGGHDRVGGHRSLFSRSILHDGIVT